MAQLGDHQIKILIPEQTITVNTEFLDGDFDDTNDPKIAALTAIKSDHMDDIFEDLSIEIISATPR